MSKTTIRAEQAEKIKKKLAKGYARKVRSKVQRVRPQVLNLQNLDFIEKTMEVLIERGRIPPVDIRKASKEDLQTARKIAKKYQDQYLKEQQQIDGEFFKIDTVQSTSPYKRLADVRKKEAEGIDIGTHFLIRGFKEIADLKAEIVDEILKDYDKKIRDAVKKKVDRGHGAEGGDAVSHLQLAEAAQVASEEGVSLSKLPGLSNYFEEQFETTSITTPVGDILDIVQNVLVEYQTLIDANGNVRAEYVPVITLQDYISNRGIDAVTERWIVDTVREFFELSVQNNTLVNMEGSPSLKETIEIVTLDTLVGKKKQKGVKVTRRVNKKKDTKRKSVTTKSKKVTNKAKTNAPKRGKAPIRAKKKTKENVISFPKIFAILKSRINAVVAKNMGSPALNYRTGRFAASVDIIEVSPTAQGFPSVGYTYMKRPYQTFEPGFLQGSPDRDPRKLIDMSIREIASQLAIGRLYTRRL